MGLPAYQAGARERVLVKPMDIEAFLTRKEAPRADITALVNDTLRELAGVR